MIPVLLLFVCAAAHAQIAPPAMDPLSFSGPDPTEQFGDISIEQKLDAQINLDLYFTTSEGQRVQLRDLMDGRPALLALVYYECPSLCKAELQGLEVVVSAMKFNPGEDYNIITVSIDPGETPEMAKEKKDIHVANVKRPGAEKGWHFLIGEEDAVSELANSVGFRYIYDPATDMYAHAAGIIALTPGGKTSRYFYGIEYIKRDVEWGLTEASEGTIGNIVDKLVLLCFQYDPTTGHYGLYVIRTLQLGSLLLILIFGSMYFLFYLRSRKKDSPDSIHEISGTHHGITS
jgi:protein SCO1/2